MEHGTATWWFPQQGFWRVHKTTKSRSAGETHLAMTPMPDGCGPLGFQIMRPWGLEVLGSIEPIVYKQSHKIELTTPKNNLINMTTKYDWRRVNMFPFFIALVHCPIPSQKYVFVMMSWKLVAACAGKLSISNFTKASAQDAWLGICNSGNLIWSRHQLLGCLVAPR